MIAASDLTKSFRSGWRGRPQAAIRNVHLQVASGESLALIGPNGAGKSTLLLILAGVRRASSGSLEVTGSVGVVPERPALYERLTPTECLKLSATVRGVSPVESAARTADLFDRLGLGAYADDPIRTLSTGWRQRVAVAQALLHAPGILLLDEPLGGLDPESSEQIIAVLAEERKRGATLIVATHRLADFARLCDRVALISDGRLRNLGPMDDVIAHLPSRITYSLPTGKGPPVEAAGGALRSSLVLAGRRAEFVAHIHEQGGDILRVEPNVASLADSSADAEETLA